MPDKFENATLSAKTEQMFCVHTIALLGGIIAFNPRKILKSNFYLGNDVIEPGGDTPIYCLYGYVPLERVWFSRQAIYSGIGSSNHRKLVWYRVPFNGFVKRTKILITKD